MRLTTLLSFFAISIGAVGCGGTPSTVSGTLSLTSPANNATVVATGNKIPVEFDTNYVLKPFGGCDGQTGCGSVFLQVDGSACYASGEVYNTLATASPTDVDLSLCAMVPGTHTISAELHQDDAAHDFVENSVTKAPLKDSVTVTVTVAP